MSTNNDDDSFQNDSFTVTKPATLAPSIETAIKRQHESLFAHSQVEEILPDGSVRGQATTQQQMLHNMHQMYLREKPLLDKIKQMRIEHDAINRRL